MGEQQMVRVDQVVLVEVLDMQLVHLLEVLLFQDKDMLVAAAEAAHLLMDLVVEVVLVVLV
jgi:hypothetical protein